jgi:hypothetical protein
MLEPGVRVCRVPDFPYAAYYIIESSEIVIVAVKIQKFETLNVSGDIGPKALSSGGESFCISVRERIGWGRGEQGIDA